MRTTGAFNLLLISLTALTLPWKVVANNEAVYDTRGSVIRFLTVQGFGVTEQTPMNGVSVIRGTRGDCSMIIAEASRYTAARFIMRHLTTAMDERFVVSNGDVYDGQPTWRTITQDWWTRHLLNFRLVRNRSLPIMVAANSACRAKRLPWMELSGGELPP